MRDSNRSLWKQFKAHKIGLIALSILILFGIIGLYAPFLVSNKPLAIYYEDHWYFPLFRYLFFKGFYTKPLDIFYNILMFTLPTFLVTLLFFKKNKIPISILFTTLQVSLFIYSSFFYQNDPASSGKLNQERQHILQQSLENKKNFNPSWKFELNYMTPYGKLNKVLRYRQELKQHLHWETYADNYKEKRTKEWENKNKTSLQTLSKEEQELYTGIPSPYQLNKNNTYLKKTRLEKKIATEIDPTYTKKRLEFIEDKEQWLIQQNKKISFILMPPLRHFHWEEDIGGNQSFNQSLSWWEVTRINRKDMLSSLIFGIRISLMVGLTALAIQLLIGIPIGSVAGYFGGKWDIIIQRIVEVWEGMPTFFMLLLIVSITQSKSIFLIIIVLGIFGWTGFSRFIRAEILKQRNLPYVESCYSMGFSHSKIIFKHIIPNAIPPILTLIPFAMLAAITSEAGLSFLGLGEEGSCSWGVLMDEGRQAFPGESYLLWPPAFILTIMLIAIALLQDSLRDTLDPKMKK